MKIIRVDVAAESISVDELPKEYQSWGGRGLTSLMINNEVRPECDPLGPENKLIIAPGFLSGTDFVNTSRVSIGAKSPLTGGIKESNAGGSTGSLLGKLGIGCIVVENKPSEDQLFVLKITGKGDAKLIRADQYKGVRTYSLVAFLQQEYGKKTSILSIGPAGEFQLASASIQATDVDGRPCRAAGRGGMGAVMGSKGIKAIVFEKGSELKPEIKNPAAFKEAVKIYAKLTKEMPFTGKMLPALGTAGLVGAVNSLGAFPSMNATQGIMDGWENISGETLAKMISERKGNPTHMGCSQCIVRCSNEFVNEKGEYVTSSLEYETIWAFGGMTGIQDLDTIAKLDFLCDDIGVDTMNIGVGISVAMDAGSVDFGDGKAAVNMVEEIAKGSEMGIVLGNGPDHVGRHLKHSRVPTVKGQSIAAYDPRGMQGNAVTYATSPMGADHTAGNLVGMYLNGVLDPLQAEGQVEASRNAQMMMVLFDWTGLCLLAGAAVNTPEGKKAFINAINAKSGDDFSFGDLMGKSLLLLRTEREFNRNAGLQPEDDRLPEFFYKEPLPPHNKVVQIKGEDLDKIFDL